MDIKHELVAILGFDPEELNTPEMDLMRFGIIENGGDTQANTPGKPGRTMEGPPTPPPKSRYKAAYRAVCRSTVGCFASAISVS